MDHVNDGGDDDDDDNGARRSGFAMWPRFVRCDNEVSLQSCSRESPRWVGGSLLKENKFKILPNRK